MLQYLFTIDQNILSWIQEYMRNDVLSPIFIFITNLGNVAFIWIFLSLVLLMFKKTRMVGLLSLIALLLSGLVNNLILKNLVARIRPYEVIPGLQTLIGIQKDYSFPSGHTGSSFASAITMYFGLPKKMGIPAVILATLIGLSRLYVGVHYPTDVFFGALIGVGIAVLLNKSGIKTKIGKYVKEAEK